MKIDQICFYVRGEEHEERIKKQFGLLKAEWIKDTVEAISHVYNLKKGSMEVTKSVGKLQYNYDLGIELEILRYTEGHNWHDFDDYYNDPNISHIGIHLDDNEQIPSPSQFYLVQETWTKKHTNPYIADLGRTYHYCIYQICPGSYIKYIQRIRGPKELGHVG